MKKILFLHRGNKVHSLFIPIIHYPPVNYQYYEYKHRLNLERKIYKNNISRDLINNPYIVNSYHHLKNKMDFIINHNKEIDLIVSAHRIIHSRKKPWIVFIEHVGDICPIIYDVDNIHIYRKYIESNLQRRQCKNIIAYLNSEKDTLYRFLKCEKFSEKIKVIPLSTTPKIKLIKKDTNNVEFLFIGTSNISNLNYSFRERGGVETIIAFNILSKKYDNIKLTIRSKIPTDVIIKYKKILNNDKINIINKILKTEEYNEIMKNTDVLLFPGYITPAMTFIEAMSFEIPIITTNWRGNHELVNHDINGYIIKSPYNINPIIPLNSHQKYILFNNEPDKELIIDLVNNMKNMIENKKQRKKMGKNGRYRVEKGRHSITSRNLQLKKIYGEAIKK